MEHISGVRTKNVSDEPTTFRCERNSTDTNPSRFFQPKFMDDLVILAVIWTCAVALVNPLGDFPLNDDWSYSIAVERFLTEGNFQPTGWTSMSLLSHVLLGSVSTHVFGFSFQTLRFSTLVMSLIGINAYYLIIRSLQQPRWLAIFVTLLVSLNPLFFSLSNTFMTDIPFLTLSIVSMAFFLQHLQTRGIPSYVAAVCLSVGAILCRQNGLFIPISFGFAYLFGRTLKFPDVTRALLPTIVGVLMLVLFQQWMDETARTPSLYGMQIGSIFDVPGNSYGWLLLRAIRSAMIIILYLGAFLFPLLLLIPLPKIYLGKHQVNWAIVLLAALFLCVPMWYLNSMMPISGNIVTQFGIGPFTLADVELMKLPNLEPLPPLFWVAVSLASVIGGGILLIRFADSAVWIFRGIRSRQFDYISQARMFCGTATLILFGGFCLVHFWDRYLLPFLVLAPLVWLSTNVVRWTHLSRHKMGQK